jgi:tetrahydromethanopterin S-methyltransferase subunit A
MAQFVLNIPEEKVPFFMQLVNEFNFIEIENHDYEIPEEVKNLVRERIKNSRKSDYIDADVMFQELDKLFL